jgi:MBG domain-containing protein
MDRLKNLSATLLPFGKSTRLKSITYFSTVLLLAMLALAATAAAQTNPMITRTATAVPAQTLTVTVIDAARFYGDPNPQFTATFNGLNAGDNITATFSTIADSGSAVGSYLITATLNDPDGKLGNYVVVINNGTLTVSPAPLSIVADDLSRAAGQPNPAFTGTVTGVKNGDAITATFDSAANGASGAGKYAIVPTLKDGSGNISNYAVTISNGTLTVTP